MQIHHGKCHSELFECGLCDFEAKTLDNLELHLTTCETYECEEYEFVSKHISGIKKHFLENIKCAYSRICHSMYIHLMSYLNNCSIWPCEQY